MAVTDGLKNIQLPVCGGNFYKSIDKIFLVRECRGMRKVFLLFMGMLSCGAFMCAESGLEPLGDLYAEHQGEPEFWPEVLEKTEDFVKEALKESADVGSEAGVKLEGLDFCELGAFLSNQWLLEDFVKSDYFVKEEHAPSLINLFRLGYKTAAGFDASIMKTEGYMYVFSGDDVDILRLCGMGSNQEARKVILRNTPDEEDY